MIYRIFTDSSIEPFNPGGILTWAYIVYFGKKKIHEDTKIHGYGMEMTNNLGEYLAVVQGMLWLLKKENKKYPTFFMSDSQLVVNQCNKLWQCKSENLVKYNEFILKAKSKYKEPIKFNWIPRTKNQEADELSRKLYTKEMLEDMKQRRLDIIHDGDDIPF